MKRTAEMRCVDGGMVEAAVLDVSEVVALEQRIAKDGIPLLDLMTRAGTELAKAASDYRLAGGPIDGPAVVLAGSGNNGGDGWVAARMLALSGHDVILVTKAPAEELAAEPARTAALEASATDLLNVVVFPTEERLASLLQGASIIVDAVLGIGFAHNAVREPYAGWIRLANEAHDENGVRIVAADCPSGLNACTGFAAKDCISADCTVTMIAPKTGLLKESARTYVGTLLLAPITSIDGYLDGSL